MKILYDHQIFSFQKYGGISRYFQELYNRIKSEKYLALVLSNNEYLKRNQKLLNTLKFINSKYIWRINKAYSILCIHFGKFDIIHPTYYDPYIIEQTKKPIVLTIYDMIHEKLPDYFQVDDVTAMNKKNLALAANKIIAISQNTKNDIIELYGIESSKIAVIHLATSMIPLTQSTLINLPKSYVLFTGNRKDYKNFDTFIRGVYRVLLSQNDLYLVCVGGGAFTSSETEMLEKLGILDKVIQRSVDDIDLPQYYQSAEAFVFPSLYEGFGIPILEAYACGCPVILSNTSCFPEIAGDAGIYFDPYDETSIEISVKKVLESKNIRENLIKLGYERLKNFSWEKAAMQTNELYNQIYNS